MKKLILVIFIIPHFIFSQIEESYDSKFHRYLAQQERKKAFEDTLFKEFYLKNELLFYIKGEMFGEFQKPTYQAMIRSCNDIIKVEKRDSVKKIYYDTLNQIQDKMEMLNFLDDISYRTRISWYSKGTKPNRLKIDSIFLREFVNRNNFEIELLKFYFTNLYFLYKENGSDLELKRIFVEYINFRLNDSISDEHLKPISDIFKSVYNKENVLESEEIFWQTWNSDKKRLDVIIDILQENKCITSSFYKNTLDTLVKVEKIPLNYFKILNFWEITNNKLKYDETLALIKKDFPQYRDEIDFNKCVELFNQKKWMSAYKLAISIGGKFKGEALKIAAMSVSSLAPQSGSSTFERKCNYYYAIQLLEKANEYGVKVQNLIKQFRTMTPNSTEKFEQGNPKTIKLTTWDIVVIVN